MATSRSKDAIGLSEVASTGAVSSAEARRRVAQGVTLQEALLQMSREALVPSTQPIDGPRPGDLYALAQTADDAIEWAVLDLDGARVRVVPADTFPMAGSADVRTTAAGLGTLVLRCGHDHWLAVSTLEAGRRSGTLSDSDLERARQKRDACCDGAPDEQDYDADPEYRAWVATLTRAIRSLDRLSA